MTPKYQNKYRIPSARLAGWDYGWDGGYFVTICTRDHECIFGDVVDDLDGDAIMELSKIGVIANDCWAEIPKHFPFARLGVYVVMIRADFKWQARFHDHIIRDGEEFDRISDYIINNPRKWKQDKFYPKKPGTQPL